MPVVLFGPVVGWGQMVALFRRVSTVVRRASSGSGRSSLGWGGTWEVTKDNTRGHVLVTIQTCGLFLGEMLF